MTSSKKRTIDFESALLRERESIDRRLGELLERIPERLSIREAIRYSLLGGGKRLRPVLCLWTHDAVGGRRRDVCLDVACALETLHTYSLIHDDLPSMDNDDMRRGMPSSHRRFGEAMAILTGDALLALSFEILSGVAREGRLESGSAIELVGILSSAGGAGGLVTGQVMDLESQKLPRRQEVVDEIHTKKTALLISAAMEMGALVGGADLAQREALKEAGILAGRAFQIVDDILDVVGESHALGKSRGKDEILGKLTYPALLGLEASKKRAGELVRRSKELLGVVRRPERLSELLDYMVERAS